VFKNIDVSEKKETKLETFALTNHDKTKNLVYQYLSKSYAHNQPF